MSGVIAKFIATFGLGTAIAVYLLYFLTNIVNAQLLNLQSSLTNASTVMTSHQTDVAFLVKSNLELQSQLRTLNLTLQSICVNTASNAQLRNACFRTVD